MFSGGKAIILDSKFRQYLSKYVFQMLMTVLSVFSILLFLDLISEEVFVASFGASTFILFTTQNPRFSSARSVLGGTVLGLFVALLIRKVDLSTSRVNIE